MGAGPLPSTIVSTDIGTGATPVVLAIQNDQTDPPLWVGQWLAESGISVRVIEACFGEQVPAAVPEGVHGVLALGGAMGAGDDGVAPWLVAERALLADATDRGIPVLGLCLGAQLLAAATGGRVELGPVPEIGVVSVFRTLEGLVDPVIGAVGAPSDDIPAGQWHQDHIVALPDDGVLLLTNEVCRVQGFRVGDNAYGLQLHPEIDADIFASWAGIADEVLDRSGCDFDAECEQFRKSEADLIRTWRPMTRAWADLVWQCATPGSR